VLETREASPEGRARYQMAVHVCRRCEAAEMEGGGQLVPISPEALARARCDAQDIGSIEARDVEAVGDGGPSPPEAARTKLPRATQDVPPATRRWIWRRDQGRCKAPGCRSARGLEVHHRVHRVDGGDHEPSNLMLLCSACHSNLHAGLLVLEGPLGDLKAVRPWDEAYEDWKHDNREERDSRGPHGPHRGEWFFADSLDV
jgi:hypothetical protein